MLYQSWKDKHFQQDLNVFNNAILNPKKKSIEGIYWEFSVHDLFKEKNPIEIEFNRFSYHYNENTAQKKIQRNTTGAKNSLFETSLEWNQTTTTDKLYLIISLLSQKSPAV